jgi:hypothetical protein
VTPQVVRIYECRVPLEGATPEAVIASLQAQMPRVVALHPQLRGCELTATETDLVMTMRVAARDRSSVLHHAKLIGGRLVHRAKLDVTKATLVLIAVPANAQALKA